MFKFLQNYFAFTYVELAGTISIGVVAIATIVATFFLQYDSFPEFGIVKPPEDATMNFVDFKTSENKSYAFNKWHKPTKLNLFNFDPNNVDSLAMLGFGLPPWTIRSILKYRAKGGYFKASEDLKKIFTLKPEDFKVIESYIKIPEKTNEYKIDHAQVFLAKVKKKQIIELNSADTLLLEELPGIGPSFANRIAKYRDMIGGFVTKEQLFEVWGFDSVLYFKIEPQIFVDASRIKTININSNYEADLYHPYLTRKQSRIIFNYRKQHGLYRNDTELLNTSVVDQATIDKIKPYLTF